ncbi:MAG: MFS transporter [Dehalococcoidia bacterium]|nr:MAG: MFS transporter [Dehalococcoidia bacterium]
MVSQVAGSRNALWAARGLAFVAFFDLFSQFPVVAPYARQLGASPALVGVAVGAYSFANLFGNLAAGPLLDRWGRKPALVFSLCAAAGALALYSVVQSAEQLVVVRTLHGLAAAVLSPGAFALLGDNARPEARARAFGSAGALIAVAAVVGPAFAGIVRERYGAPAVFLIVAAILLATAIIIGVIVRERPPTPPDEGPIRALGTLLVRQPLATALTAILALTVSLGVLVTHLPLVLDARGEQARASGTAFSVYALVALIGLAGPASRLADRVGRRRPLAAGLLTVGLAMSVFATVGSLAGVFLASATFGLGFSLLFPAAAALVADGARAEERGAAFGLFYAVYSAGTVVGATGAGLLSERAGELSPLPFVAGAIVALAAAPVVLLARPKGDRPWSISH